MTEQHTNHDAQPPLVTSPYAEPAPFPDHMRPAPQKKQQWFKKPIVWGPALALLLGVGIGTGNKPEPERIEVTKEVPGPERTVTKTEKVEVPVTPTACLTALDLNEEAFTGLAKSMQLVMDADYAGAKANNTTVAALVPKVNAAKAECRAAQ